MIEVSDRNTVGNMEFFTLTVSGITIKDCKLVSGGKGQFVAGPSVPMLGKDKTLMLDANGKGNKAAGIRVRTGSSKMAKLCKQLRTEISTAKAAE